MWFEKTEMMDSVQNSSLNVVIHHVDWMFLNSEIAVYSNTKLKNTETQKYK